MDLKKNIRAYGYTAGQLSESLGISQQAVSQTINGNPTLSRLQQLADAMHIPLSELVADEPHPEREPKMCCPHCGHELKVRVE